MAGGSGFINNVMNAQNVNFGTVANSGPEVLTDAQLMIGNTVFPNIRTGTLTSTGGSIAITYVAPNINLELGGGAASSFPADSGTATPVAGVLNILGGPGVTTTGAGNTITINSVVWTDRAISATVTSDSGTFDTSAGTATFLLPAAPSQGEECRFVCINSGGVVQANAGQQISIGNTNSAVGGTATSTQGGDTLYLTFNAGTLRWFSIANNGNWTLA